MAVVFVIGPCFVCEHLFTFNPNHVPSTPPNVHPTREPICAGCMDRLNAKRAELGLEPFPIHPQAYEPADESEI